VAQPHGGYIENRIVKETGGFFHKVATGFFGVFFLKVIRTYLLVTLRSKWCFLFKRTLHVSTGFWLGELFKKSQLNLNENTGFWGVCPQC
jgi:hypothetical protein